MSPEPQCDLSVVGRFETGYKEDGLEPIKYLHYRNGKVGVVIECFFD
jgi:hypothetical protein